MCSVWRSSFSRAMAARLASEHHLIGHDVDRHAALDHADIRGGFMIDAAELHFARSLRRRL